MVVEFYGDITDYTKRRTDKLKKRYFAKWLAALALLLVIAMLVALFANGGFIAFLVAAIVIGVVAGRCIFPDEKDDGQNPLDFRVHIEGDFVTCTQYCEGGKTVEKKKRLDQIKRVIKTNYCYYLVYNDISNAFICERCLLKRGTFEYLESIFMGKIRVQSDHFE